MVSPFSGSRLELCRSQKNYIARIVVVTLNSTIFLSKQLRCFALCCLASSLSPLFSFQGADPRSKTGSKRSKTFKRFDPFSGGDKRDRTADLLRAKQALSQLSYTPIGKLVGPSGLEPPTLRLSVVRSSQLS